MPLPIYDYRTDERNLLVSPQIRARFMRLDPGETARAHSHDLGHEIFLVLAGKAEFTIAGETALVGPGQLCIALVDQMHSVRAIGDKPMIMYLSVTPHIQPTHTYWGPGGRRLPHRFVDSSNYDHPTDAITPLGELLDRLRATTLAIRDAADSAADAQSEFATDLADAAAAGDLGSADEHRGRIWDALFQVHRQVAELANRWNDIAPRAGRT